LRQLFVESDFVIPYPDGKANKESPSQGAMQGDAESRTNKTSDPCRGKQTESGSLAGDHHEIAQVREQNQSNESQIMA